MKVIRVKAKVAPKIYTEEHLREVYQRLADAYGGEIERLRNELTFAHQENERLQAQLTVEKKKASEAYAPFIEIFVGALSDEAKTASDLLPLFEGMTTPAGKKPSVQFVTAVGGKAVKQGLASKVDVKITGKGTQKAYVKNFTE